MRTIERKCPICDGGLYETGDGRWLHYPAKGQRAIKGQLIFACEGTCPKSKADYRHIITFGCSDKECRVPIEPELGICSEVGDVANFLESFLSEHYAKIKARVEEEKKRKAAETEKLEAQEILSILKAIVEGHFVYSQRDEATDQRFHGNFYVNKDVVLSTDNNHALNWVIKKMADKCAEHDPDVIVGPETGGSKFALLVKQELNSREGKKVQFASADKDGDNGFILRRGYDKLVQGKKVVVIEDILNSGGSAKEAVAAVRDVDGEVLALVALCNRGGVTADDIFVPILVPLLDIQMDKWLEDECPLCREHGIESVNTNLGHGDEFLKEKKTQADFESPPGESDDDIPF